MKEFEGAMLTESLEEGGRKATGEGDRREFVRKAVRNVGT